MEDKKTDIVNEENKEKEFAGDGTRPTDENIVFIGSKPLINYIKSIMIQFNKKAVDAAEISKRMLEKQAIKIKGISIASESFEKEGKKINVSTMDIVLSV